MRQTLKPGRNCWEITPVDDTGVLVDARDYYRVFYHAAKRARRYILITGWQFDSNVRLLRGDDEKEVHGDIRFLDFLNALCKENPDLRVYILAWNFSVVYMMEREWLQGFVFRSANHKQIFFHFDKNHAFGASQHQKFAVIDGRIAFVGGMDICASRWDDRRHLVKNPDRTDPYGGSYEPYHDVHSYHTGALAAKLTGMFATHWKSSTGAELDLPLCQDDGYLLDMGGIGIPVEADRVAISRTRARTFLNPRDPIREIRHLYIDAIRKAEEFIYIENQYFSSYAVYRALKRRMKARKRSRLQIVMVLPMRRNFLEKIFAGIAQARLLRSLTKAARRGGHSLGIYYPAGISEDGREHPVYIHSKLMLIDDRFLTIGSANTSNRSMGLDTELNVSWEAEGDHDRRLMDSIKRVRVDLLAEHTGMSNYKMHSRLEDARGLVAYLDEVARRPFSRLRRRKMDTSIYISRLLRALKMDRLIIDPENPVITENILELVRLRTDSFLSKTAAFFKNLFKRKRA